MQVATALAVSWKPLTNSKPRAMKRATPSRMKGKTEAEWTTERSAPRCRGDVDDADHDMTAKG